MQSAFLVIVDPNSQDGSVDLGYYHRFTEVRRTVIAVNVAQSLIDTFIALPQGCGDLCFEPVFVIEMRFNGVIQWAGGPCFECGTYYSTDGRGPTGGMFDQTSDASKQLLNRMRELA